jgi:hypothetical protein
MAAREVLASLQAHDLTDGTLTGRWDVAVALQPGERRVVVEVDRGSLDPGRTLMSASLDGTSTFRLLAEPRDLQLPCARLEASWDGAQLRLETELPVVDLHLWSDAADFELLDDFITLPAGGSARLRARGDPAGLLARSLAGLHPIEWRPGR